METVRINKGNWSGEEADIKLYADGKKARIEDRGISFRLRESFRMKEEALNMDLIEYVVDFKEDGDKEWSEMDWKVSTDNTVGEGWHYATTWNGESGRESTKDVRLAVAQLIFNIV